MTGVHTCALPISLGEALRPEFRAYQQQVIDNARVLVKVLQERGLRIVSGRTESHLFLVDLRPKGIIQALDLLRPIYTKTAVHGHFGRDEPEFSWEATDKVAALKADAAR